MQELDSHNTVPNVLADNFDSTNISPAAAVPPRAYTAATTDVTNLLVDMGM